MFRRICFIRERGVQVSLLAAQLQQNAQEDYRVYHRIAAASRLGVRPSTQHQTSDCWSLTISPQSSVHLRLSVPSCSVSHGHSCVIKHGLSVRSSVVDACAHHTSSNNSTLYSIVNNCGHICIVQC